MKLPGHFPHPNSHRFSVGGAAWRLACSRAEAHCLLDLAMKTEILLTHHLIELPSTGVVADVPAPAALGTLLANLAHYGYAPAQEVLACWRALSAKALATVWGQLEPALKKVTGADRPMGEFVVYKNFPKEVLSLSEARYWYQQILLYLGVPVDFIADEPAERAALDERLALKVLRAAPTDALTRIHAQLVMQTTRWTPAQAAHAAYLASALGVTAFDLADYGFKENGIVDMAARMGQEGSFEIVDATDVLRLASVLSGADAGLREPVKFRSFSRPERRTLVALLEATKHLTADIAARPAPWKKLLARLHPGDFKAPRVHAAYDALYQGRLTSFNAQVEAKLRMQDASVLADLQSRPGEFMRRLHALYAVFGLAAVKAFAPLAGELSTAQLLKLRGYLTTINSRLTLVYPPKGNWTKLQVAGNLKVPLTETALLLLKAALDRVLAQRLARAFPEGVALAEETDDIKLQTNDQELAPYGRGTVFPIPAEMTFVRSASYWQHSAGGHSTWFDNGWNFFDEHWHPQGTCCWNHTHDMSDAAVFSGDPTNVRDLKGRACQMIDLYLDKLAQRGVRYAVWNVLCYSNIAFSEADEVLATLQWGTRPQAGKLYEPARAQMVFPLKGHNKTKYVAYIDVVHRKLVYLDANLAGDVSSAGNNAAKLAQVLPAFLEYLRTLPSVADVFVNAPVGTVPVLYSDAGHTFEQKGQAYVFRPENPANAFEAVDLGLVLAAR